MKKNIFPSVKVLDSILEGYPVVAHASNGYSYTISFERSGFDEEFILHCSAGITIHCSSFDAIVAQLSRLNLKSIVFNF